MHVEGSVLPAGGGMPEYHRSGAGNVRDVPPVIQITIDPPTGPIVTRQRDGAL